MPDPLALLDNSKYLYLRRILEPRDNSVTIIVDQAAVGDAEPAVADGPFSRYGAILTNAHCQAFELHWKNYVAYLVTEECVGSCGNYKDEAFTGNRFRHYTKSHFLEHCSRDTGGHFAPLLHFKLICLNHLVDVAATEPPQVRLIAPEVHR